jgi:hypothetical protein
MVYYAGNSFLDMQGQFTAIQRSAIGPSESAQMHQKGFSPWVSEIKELRELAERSVCKRIVPPWIVTRRRHVIRHDIEQYLETVRASALDEPRPRGFATKIGADPSGVRDVISMLAAGHCLKAWRQIHMADSQFGQIG